MGGDAADDLVLPLVQVGEYLVLALEIGRSEGQPQRFREIVLYHFVVCIQDGNKGSWFEGEHQLHVQICIVALERLSCVLDDELQVLELQQRVIVDLLDDLLLLSLVEALQQAARLLVVNSNHLLQSGDDVVAQGLVGLLPAQLQPQPDE